MQSLLGSIRERDPFNFRLITVFVATLVELGKKRELYHYAHQMVADAGTLFHMRPRSNGVLIVTLTG